MTTCTGSGFNEQTHEEIVYDYGFCPLCRAIEERDEAEEKLRDTEKLSVGLARKLAEKLLVIEHN